MPAQGEVKCTEREPAEHGISSRSVTTQQGDLGQLTWSLGCLTL